MSRFLDTLWRFGMSVGLLALAVSCSNQLPAQSTPSQPIPEASATPLSVPTSVPLTSLTAAPTITLVPVAPTNTPTPSQAPSVAISPTPPVPAPNTGVPSVVTITLADSGKTIQMQPNQYILLQLGAEYDWQISTDNPSVLSLAPNSVGQNSQGMYQAHQLGLANLSGTGNPKCLNSVPRCLSPSRLFQLRVTVSATVPPAPTSALGGPTIGVFDNGKTITLHTGDRVTLDLGTDYVWDEVVSTNPNVLSRVIGILTVRGAQGIFEAKSPGTSTLETNGRNVCPPNRMCPQIIFHYSVQVVVR